MLAKWCDRLQEECKLFERNVSIPREVEPCYAMEPSVAECPELSLMPPFILWSPLEQFGESYGITFTCPKCDVIPSELKAVGWQCGLKGSSTNPRVIHSVDSAVLVVGRTYRCSSSHTVLAYHPDLMQKLPKSLVPFQTLAPHRIHCKINELDTVFGVGWCEPKCNNFNLELKTT